MNSENSNFYLSKSHWIIISTLLFLFVNAISSFLYISLDVPDMTPMNAGFFNLVKTLLINSLFWVAVGKILKDFKSALISLLVSVILTGGLGFYPGVLLKLDNDNLIIKSLAFAIPFYLFGALNLKKPVISLGLLFTAIIPMANIDLGHQFISNFSLLAISNIPKIDWLTLKLNLNEISAGYPFGFSFDILAAVARTFLFFVQFILFFELYRLIRGGLPKNIFKSNFNIKNAYSKPFAFAGFIAFKTIIYYLVASITIIVLGANNFPLLQNKIAQAIYLSGSIFLLIFCVVYFRKFLSEQLVPGKTFPLVVYALSLLPVLDNIALFLLLVAPKPNVMQNFRAENKGINQAKLIVFLKWAGIQFILIAYTYWFFYKSVPLNDSEVSQAAFFQFLLLPGLGAAIFICSYFSFRASQLLFFFQIVALVYICFKCIPLTETVFPLELMVFDVTKNLIFIFVSFCIIPVLHLKKFYR
jgi:hypothetical protein